VQPLRIVLAGRLGANEHASSVVAQRLCRCAPHVTVLRAFQDRLERRRDLVCRQYSRSAAYSGEPHGQGRLLGASEAQHHVCRGRRSDRCQAVEGLGPARGQRSIVLRNPFQDGRASRAERAPMGRADGRVDGTQVRLDPFADLLVAELQLGLGRRGRGLRPPLTVSRLSRGAEQEEEQDR
jgi:hypothetical protein